MRKLVPPGGRSEVHATEEEKLMAEKELGPIFYALILPFGKKMGDYMAE